MSIPFGTEGVFVAHRSRTVAAEPDTCCASVLTAPLAEADAEELARAFAALADPVRLRLLSLVAAAVTLPLALLIATLKRRSSSRLVSALLGWFGATTRDKKMTSLSSPWKLAGAPQRSLRSSRSLGSSCSASLLSIYSA